MAVNFMPRLNSVLPRIGLYVLASVLLHALVLMVIDHRLQFASSQADADHRWMDAALIAPPAPAPPTPKPAAKPRPPKLRPAPPAEPSAPAAMTAAPTESPPQPAPQPETTPAPEPAAAASATEAPLAPQPPEPPSLPDKAPTPTVTHWPPSGHSHYIVQALQSGMQYHGVSDLDWTIDGLRYRIEQTTGVDLLVTTLNLQSSTSEGTIDATGLAPTRYTERRRNRAAVATNFNRDGGHPTITFSSSANEFALTDGAQDRASVVFQLAGMLASQTDTTPLQRYDVLLAGIRDTQPWRFDAAGSEIVHTGIGDLQALRFVREPQPQSYESRIELWYAQAANWYPVKIRYTERNGDVIEMTLDRLEAALPPLQ